jgi:hypothetical protein
MVYVNIMLMQCWADPDFNKAQTMGHPVVWLWWPVLLVLAFLKEVLARTCYCFYMLLSSTVLHELNPPLP